MKMTENANFIEFLQAIDWTDGQITNFILVIEGRRSIDEGVRKNKETSKQ